MTNWHLIDGSDLRASALVLRYVADLGDSVVLIGDRRLVAMSQSAGVAQAKWIPAVLGCAALTAPALRVVARERQIQSVVTWSASMTAIARRWLACEVTQQDPALLTLSHQASQSLTVHPVRTQMRNHWRVDDRTGCVLLLPANSVGADAYDGAMAVGVAAEALSVADVATSRFDTIRLVVNPSCKGRLHALSLWRDFRQTQMLISEPRALEPWAILPAIDAVINLGPDANVWDRTCQSMGLPLIQSAWLPSRVGQVVDVRRLAGDLTEALS